MRAFSVRSDAETEFKMQGGNVSALPAGVQFTAEAVAYEISNSSIGEGLHSSTFHLNLSRFCHSNQQTTPKALTLSRNVDKCKGLPLVHFLAQT